MFDFNTYTKKFQETTTLATEFFAPKEFIEVQEKSKAFTLDLLTATTEATQSSLEAFGKLANKDVEAYFTKASNLVDTTYQYAKEIIETGSIKNFSIFGYTK